MKPPPRLRKLETWMWDALSRRLAGGERLRPRAAARASRWIVPNRRMRAAERLEVYNQQYWYRLLESLAEDFPRLKKALGERAFRRLCEDYLEAHPSSSYTLRNLGRRLPDFLRARPRLGDIARFEWALIEAYDAAELPPPDPKRLRPASRIRLQPHLGLLALTRPRKRFLAVYRRQGQAHYRPLEPEAYALLQALGKGRTLAAACVSVKGLDPAVVGPWFRTWASLGWFA